MAKRTASAIGRRNRQRGSEGERELCHLLSDAFGEQIRRKLGQARDAGHDVDVGPFQIECKRRKKIANLYEWMGQAQGKRAGVPVIALRSDGREWFMVMRFIDWCAIAREEVSK